MSTCYCNGMFRARMKRLKSVLLGAALLFALPALSQWTRGPENDDGTIPCVRESGETFETGYISRSYATAICNVLIRVESLFGMSVAEAQIRVTLTQCSDGSLRASCPVISGFAFTGTIPHFSGLLEDTDTISYDLSQHCTGADCASVTYALDAGQDCTTSQMTVSTDTLTNDGTMTEGGFCRVTLSFGGDTEVSNTFAWSFFAAPSSDEIAPSIPTGITTTGGDGTVALRWLASTDVGGEGVGSYLVKNSATDATIATVTTGVEPGLQLLFTEDEIGTVGGTPAYDVTGLDHDITCEGTGLATDDICAIYAPIEGDFSCHFTVTALTPSTGETFHQGGMGFRASLDSGSIGNYTYVQYDADGEQRFQVRERNVAGESAPALVNSLLTFRSYRFTRVGNTWTYYHRSAASAQWEQVAQNTQALPSSGYVYSWATKNAGMSAVEYNSTQVACNNAPALEYVHTTAVPVTYDISARDNAGTPNVSADSVAVLGTPGAAPSDGEVKFNPGAYILFPSGDDLSTIINSRIPELCAMPNVKGIVYRTLWGNLETTEGNYTLGDLTSLYNAISGCSKRLIVQSQVVRFNTNCSGITPAYIQSQSVYEGGVTLASNNSRCIAMLWKGPVMDRYIALKTAIANQFEGLPFFEGIIISETAVGPMPASAEYSTSAFVTQLERAIDAAADDFPTSQKWLFSNFLTAAPTSTLCDLIQYMAANDVGMSGPDTLPPPQDETQGFMAYRGTAGGCPDLRGAMFASSSVQSPEMGGSQGNFTCTELYNHAAGTNEVSHIFWTRKDWEIAPSGGDNNDKCNWTTALKSFINAGSANISVSCPTLVTQGCDP